MDLADLNQMKVRDMRKLAGELGISGRNEMNRGQLIDALSVPILELRIAALEETVRGLVRESHKVNPFEMLGG